MRFPSHTSPNQASFLRIRRTYDFSESHAQHQQDHNIFLMSLRHRPLCDPCRGCKQSSEHLSLFAYFLLQPQLSFRKQKTFHLPKSSLPPRLITRLSPSIFLLSIPSDRSCAQIQTQSISFLRYWI